LLRPTITPRCGSTPPASGKPSQAPDAGAAAAGTLADLTVRARGEAVANRSVSVTGCHSHRSGTSPTSRLPITKDCLKIKYRYTDATGVRLQLCQPCGGGSPQWAFLQRIGGGVFHIGFVVDDVDESTEQVHALGVETWMYGRRDDRTDFTDFKTPRARRRHPRDSPEPRLIRAVDVNDPPPAFSYRPVVDHDR
jgi:hypothetical protein